MRGPNIDTDHYLLKIIVNQKLPKIYLKRNRDHTGMWDKSILKNPKNFRNTEESFTQNC